MVTAIIFIIIIVDLIITFSLLFLSPLVGLNPYLVSAVGFLIALVLFVLNIIIAKIIYNHPEPDVSDEIALNRTVWEYNNRDNIKKYDV